MIYVSKLKIPFGEALGTALSGVISSILWTSRMAGCRVEPYKRVLGAKPHIKKLLILKTYFVIIIITNKSSNTICKDNIMAIKEITVTGMKS